MFEPPRNVTGDGPIPTWLYLDDVRLPAPQMGANWHIVRSWREFALYLQNNPMPALISFDHDLGVEKGNPHVLARTGMDCANALVRHCMKTGAEAPLFTVHSQNPVGAQNILSLLNNYRKSEGQEPNGYATFWEMAGTIETD